jgi:pimeloyl-ACP methyl ester carboxylesterase
MSYAQVNGLNMYYEIHGTGRPLVLLHGNLSTIEVDFGRMIPTLAKTRLVLASASYALDGLHPEVLGGIQQIQPERLAGTPFEEGYARVAPRPQDWPVLIEKIKQMDSDPPEWPAETIKNLGKPVLLVIGDSDIVRPEHAVEFFRLLGGGVVGDLSGLPSSRLAVLPGTTHVTLVHRADWLASMAEEFLEA